MYTYVTIYITDHTLSLCAVLYMYTYIQIYVIVYITGHVLSLCVICCTSGMGIVCLGWVGRWGGGLYIQMRLVVQKLQHV